MRIEDLDYHLPVELIAQRPLDRRDASRMLLLNRKSGEWRDEMFSKLAQLLRGDELLVFNNARVIPARLFGRRMKQQSNNESSSTGASSQDAGLVEIFLAKRLSSETWEALVRPGRKLQVGARIQFGMGELEAEITERAERGLRTIRLATPTGEPIDSVLEKLGHVPLPPYINRDDEAADRTRYQTVFAKRPGAVAAPTAGLHFSQEILDAIRKRGVETCEVTLDVGLGTFQPIHAEDLQDHVMHGERYEISDASAKTISEAKKNGKTILCIGTTVVRTLEDAAIRARDAGGELLVTPGVGEARLFITPGFRFQIADALLTNFHLPRSTLLAMIFAFAGRENILTAYKHAVEARYRFYSYGDCMLIR